MSELREVIIEDLMMEKKFCGEHERKQAIQDFVLISFLHKNDCLPERACVKLELQDFMDCYIRVDCPLTKFDKIIPENLAKFFQELARVEMRKMRDDAHETVAGQMLCRTGRLQIPERQSSARAKRKEVAALVKDDPQFKEKEKQRIIEQKKSITIDEAMLITIVKTKKKVYYESKGYDTPEKISRLVVNYLNLLASNWEHVLTGNSSCRWTYCVPLAPYFSDMVGNIVFEDGRNTVCIRPSPLEHLSSVLPQPCFSLLPKTYQLYRMVESINRETDVEELIRKLRELNPNRDLTEEESRRNRQSNPLVFPNGTHELRHWRACYEKGDEKYVEKFKDDEFSRPFRCCLPPVRNWEQSMGTNDGFSEPIRSCLPPAQNWEPSMGTTNGDISRDSPLHYLDFFPIGICRFISGVRNVNGDGNCGFRAIAHAVYGNEDEWSRVRRELFEEMHGYRDRYFELLGGEDTMEYENCIAALPHDDGRCGWDSWYDIQVSWAVCNLYHIVLSIVSNDEKKLGNRTYFPTKGTTVPLRHIWLGFSGTHFVQLFVDGCPMPKVHASWHRYSDQTAKGNYQNFKLSTHEDNGALYHGSYDESSV